MKAREHCSPLARECFRSWRRLQLIFGFSLVEVVLALGVISFAIVAILGVLPVGLQTGHSAQDETRAAQIAQAILASIASQAPNQFDNVQVQLNDDQNSTVPFHLGATETVTLYGANDGKLVPTPATAAYTIIVTTNSSPTGFDPGYASQVTVRVIWPANAPAVNQTFRDFIRIIAKY